MGVDLARSRRTLAVRHRDRSSRRRDAHRAPGRCRHTNRREHRGKELTPARTAGRSLDPNRRGRRPAVAAAECEWRRRYLQRVRSCAACAVGSSRHRDSWKVGLTRTRLRSRPRSAAARDDSPATSRPIPRPFGSERDSARRTVGTRRARHPRRRRAAPRPRSAPGTRHEERNTKDRCSAPPRNKSKSRTRRLGDVKLDGTLHGPSVFAAGRGLSLGELVTIQDTPESLVDVDGVELPPFAVFGTIEHVDNERGEIVIDFATAGRYTVALDSAAAATLEYGYADLAAVSGATSIESQLVTSSREHEPPFIELYRDGPQRRYARSAALSYAAQGWPVFPCHSVGARGCSCCQPDCSSPGKHPASQEDCTPRARIVRP